VPAPLTFVYEPSVEGARHPGEEAGGWHRNVRDPIPNELEMTGMRIRAEWMPALYLAGVSVVGAVCLARIPAATLRGLPFSALMALVTVGCCAVAAEAVWNVRPWRFRAAAGVAAAFVLTLVAHLADWAIVGTVDGMLPIPDRIVKTVFTTYPVFLYVLYRRPVPISQGRHRIPRP
jgi:hypothetical protein